MQLVLSSSSPIEQDEVRAVSLRFTLARFTGCKIGLVVMDNAQSHNVQLVAWNTLGEDASEGSAGDEDQETSVDQSVLSSSTFSTLEFRDVSLSWWTTKRHLEADIKPPIGLKRGQIWGLLFSRVQTSIANRKDPKASVLSLAFPDDKSLAAKKAQSNKFVSFSKVLNDQGAFTVEEFDSSKGVAPIMNLVLEE